MYAAKPITIHFDFPHTYEIALLQNVAQHGKSHPNLDWTAAAPGCAFLGGFENRRETETISHAVQSPGSPTRPDVGRVEVELHQFPAQMEEHDRTGVYLRVTPHAANPWIGFFALGFDSPQVANGIYSCPDPGSLCVVIGGYAYVVDTSKPQSWMQIEQRPVVEVKAVPEFKLLLFVGFTSITGLGKAAQLWTTERLSWEGISITGIHATTLHGMAWDMITDKEVPFEVDLLTGRSTGGASPQASHQS